MYKHDALGTELSDFCRLPRPDPLLPPAPALDDLKSAFPFLFKPNRILALHSRGPGVDPGHPSEDSHGRWLLRLPLGDALDDLPPCIAVVGENGWLSLWCYDQGVGLCPLSLESGGGLLTSGNALCLRVAEITDPASGPLALLRATGQTDDEGRHYLTVDTTEGSHRLTLDFRSVRRLPQDSVPCELAQHLPYAGTPAMRQIGGWDGQESFHWSEAERRAYAGGGRRRRPVEGSPGLQGVRLHAAASDGDLIVLGGQSDRLLIQSARTGATVVTRPALPLRGNVYALTLLGASGGAAPGPLVAVGCDDHTLYVLDHAGHQLQKVRMGGLVDAILPLEPGSSDWIDLALLVRNRGLYCARLFLDRLYSGDPPDPDRRAFVARAAGLLGADPISTLKAWLASPDRRERMMAIQLVIESPDPERTALFNPASGLLQGLDDYSTGFLAHSLQRALGRIERSSPSGDDQTWRAANYLDLFLHMARGSYHSRMAVRQMEGWLLGLSLAGDQGLADRLKALAETLPDARRLYSRTVQDACHPGEQGLETAMGLLASLRERLESDRLFNWKVLIPAEGHGQIRAVAMLPGTAEAATPIYAPRGAPRLQTLGWDEAPAAVPGHVPWAPDLAWPGGGPPEPVRALVPLGMDLLLVVAADRIGWVARGEAAVAWAAPAPRALWCAAWRGTTTEALIAVSGEWDPDGGPGSPLVWFYRWDGVRLALTDRALRAPLDWQRRTQVRGLAWDESGGLWAVTTDQGDLLHWPQAEHSDPAPVLVARIGAAQYAVALVPGLVIAGGADGAARAFGRQGGLRWLFPAGGPVRSLQALAAPIQVKGRQPSLALASEAEHVVVLDDRGGPLALLFLPNSHPFSLATGLLGPDQLRLVVGTLEGELRVLELVADGWEDRYGASPDTADDLANRVKGCRDREEMLRAWCLPERARQEPLRTAWAAAQLMDLCGDAHPALDVAAGLEGLHPATRRLRALLFGILGRGMAKIEQMSLLRRIDQIALTARDGAVAALLDGLADAGPLHRATTLRLLARGHRKVLEGRPFSASATLRCLGRLPPDLAELGDMALVHGVRRVHAASGAESQLLEGLLAGLLGGDDAREPALLWALVRLPERHTAFFDYIKGLRHPKRRGELADRLLYWLDKLHGVLWGPDNRAVWEALRPFLDAEPRRTADVASLGALIAGIPAGAQADRSALDVYRALYPGPWEVPAPNLVPGPWRGMTEAARTLRDLRRQLGEQGISAVGANQLLEEGERRRRSVHCNNPLVRPLVDAWRQAWEGELAGWRDLLIPKDPADWLLPQAGPLQVMEGEAAPLTLTLQNQGPDDIREPVRFWLDREAEASLVEAGPREATSVGLQCAPDGATRGEALSLRRALRPGLGDRPVEILVHWEVGGHRRSHRLRLTPEQRWNDYQTRHPRRDRLAASLFQSREGIGFRYGRVLVRRWREASLVDGRRDLTELVRGWAGRAGRTEGLRLLTFEPAWPSAQALRPDRWEECLAAEPQGLEVWLIEESIPWGLRFLERLDQAPRTALLLPDLALEDWPAGLTSGQHRLLDTILAARGENRLAVLKLALKACVQGIVSVPIETIRAHGLPPVALGAAVRHSSKRLLARGEVPDSATWTAPRFGAWPVAGCRALDGFADLPPDGVRPLGALAGAAALRHLWRLGLIMRWGDVWIPRARGLFDYVDSAFPSRRLGEAPEGTTGLTSWSWDLTGWGGKALEGVQRRLFADPDAHPEHPPFEGLDLHEWEALREHLRRQQVADSFFALMGLGNRHGFHQALVGLDQVRALMAGGRLAMGPLLRRLGEDGVAHTELDPATVDGRNFRLIGLSPGGFGAQGGRFGRLLLLLPDPDVYRELAAAGERLADYLVPWLTRVRLLASEDWGRAIALTFFPVGQDIRGGIAPQHDLVILGSRAAVRLATSASPRTALLEAIQTQIPLSRLAQGVFQSEGPVKAGGHFFGRGDELRHLCEGLALGKSFVVTGPRSIGKSSLLLHLPQSPAWARTLEGRFTPFLLDLQEQRAGLDYAGFVDQLRKAIVRAGRSLPDLLDVQVRNALNAGFRLAPADAKPLVARVLDALELDLSPLVPVLLVDEADGFYKADRAHGEPVFTLFRARHNADRMRFVFASYPPEARNMAAAIQDAAAQTYNFLEQVKLGPLDRPAGIDLVQRGMAEVGVRLGERQAVELCDRTWGIPNLLQKACLELLRLLDMQIARGEGKHVGEAMLGSALASAQTWLLEHFMHYFNKRQVRPALYVLAALVLEQRERINPDEAADLFRRHAGGDWDKAQVSACLAPLLDTLLLERHEPGWRLGGPEGRSYFPTLALAVWGSEKLHDIVLHDMDTQIWRADSAVGGNDQA